MQERSFSQPLLSTPKEWLWLLGLLGLVFVVMVGLEYRAYTKLAESKKYYTTAQVINQYQKTKDGKSYFVLKLESEQGFVFYTTSRESLKDLRGRFVAILLFPKNIGFLEFLQSFYTPSYILRVLPGESHKEALSRFIVNLHEKARVGELFGALFLGGVMSQELRNAVIGLGASHIVAISGYHLSFLSIIFYKLLSYPYILFQSRFFPYRNRQRDLMVVVAVLLFAYLAFLDYMPSLLRAYVMFLIGFLFFDRSLRIFSFETLLLALLFILSFYPRVFFSIGFWLSVAGVFYIFLFLHHFAHLAKWKIFLALHFFVFFAMLPIVHFIFTPFSPRQLLSIPLAIAFELFYPLEIFLHLVGLADLLDAPLDKLLSLEIKTVELRTPFWFFALTLAASVAAIWSKKIFWLLLLSFLLFFAYGVYHVAEL